MHIPIYILENEAHKILQNSEIKTNHKSKPLIYLFSRFHSKRKGKQKIGEIPGLYQRTEKRYEI